MRVPIIALAVVSNKIDCMDSLCCQCRSVQTKKPAACIGIIHPVHRSHAGPRVISVLFSMQTPRIYVLMVRFRTVFYVNISLAADLSSEKKFFLLFYALRGFEGLLRRYSSLPVKRFGVMCINPPRYSHSLQLKLEIFSLSHTDSPTVHM